MSLAVLADHMASKGRGPDSMLIHMSPREVQGLQALAENHGGSLTINPETGLPEAGFLDKLLPTIIGAGLTFFGGVPPHIAAMMVGGVETVRTGDLGRGISAGLGAYGGANLTSGLMEAGASTIGATEAAKGLTMSPELVAEFGGNLEKGISANDLLLQQQVTDKIAAATPYEKLSSGFSAIGNNPMGMAKSLAMPAAMAFGPAIMAGENVQAKGPQTVTRRAMIRPSSYDPYSGIFTAGTPYEATPTKMAAGGGLMSMDNGGYDPGKLNFSGGGEPVVRMAEGGDAALAAYQAGDYATANQLLGEAGMSAQDVVNQYGLNQAQAADVATNLGYAGDMSNIQYGAGYGTTVGDLYTNILGRSGEQTGIDYWTGKFGDTIDANELAQFNAAAQVEIAARNANTGGGSAAPTYTNQYTYANINDYIANNNLDATGIAAAAKLFNVDPAQITAAQNAQETVSNVYRNVLGRDADPAGLDYWVNQIMTGKSTGQEMFNTFLQGAKTNNEIIANPNIKLEDAIKDFGGYKSANARDIADEWVRNTLGREVTETDRKQQWYKDAVNDATMTTYGKAKDIYGNFKTYAQTEAEASIAKAISDAKAVLAANKVTEADVFKQTGKTIEQLVAGGTNLGLDLYQASQLKAPGAANKFDFSTIKAAKVAPPVVTSSVVPGGTYGRPDGTTPGDVTTNPDGSVTIHPNIPYRPDGGFSGIGEVRDVWEAGGGSLGYLSPTYTREQFKELYEDKLTGGSKQSYDYLRGKTPYDPTPYTPTGELMKPYWESVGGLPENRKVKRYIYEPGSGGKRGRYVENPDYVKPKYVRDGERAAALADESKEPTESPGAGKKWTWNSTDKKWEAKPISAVSADTSNQPDSSSTGGMATGGLAAMAGGGMAGQFDLGGYSDGGRLLRGPGDGVSDSIPATIGNKRPARLADGEFVVPARIVSELGNGSTEAGARKLYAMMDRVQAARKHSIGKGKVAKNSRADKYLPA